MITEQEIREHEYELYSDYYQCIDCGDYFRNEGYQCQETDEEICDECYSRTNHDELECEDIDMVFSYY